MQRQCRWIATIVSLVSVTAGCGWFGDDWFGDDIGFYGAYEDAPGLLVVELSVCTEDDVTATVVETADEIRIDDFSATIQHGDDCNGALRVDLDEPVGDRAVVVEGKPWVPYEGTCDRQVTLVPPDIASWFTDCG